MSTLNATSQRPQKWARPLAIDAGLANLHRVSANLYRSAQPSPEAFEFLSTEPVLAEGDPPIRTIVSLRAFNDDAPRVPAGSPLRLEQIRFNTWHPEDEDVVRFLRVVTSPAAPASLVHCQYGSDRTGTMVAIYRIAVEGWTKDEALDEMIHGGFGFHPLWQNLRHYIHALDVGALMGEVGRLGAIA